MKKFLSPEELWQEFDISGPLEEEILQTDVFGEYVYEQVMFSGQKYKDGTCKIFGVFAYGKNTPKPMPCVMLVHDMGGRVDFSYIDYFLNLGLAVFMCDYSGMREGERHTIFPPSKEHMNYCKNNQPDISRGIENSVWIGDTLIFRHALKYLRACSVIDPKKIGVVSLGLGSIIGFHLALCEPDLKFCCNFHYGGWRDFEEISKSLDSDMARYLLAVAPQVYSPLAKVPLFLLGSTNTTTGDSDRIFDTFVRCNALVTNFIYLSPNYISTVDHLATRNLRMIIGEYLLDANLTIPLMPYLEYTIEDGQIFISCNTGKELHVKSVKLFYAQGENLPHLRSYKNIELVATGDGVFTCTLDISSAHLTTMFANAEFQNGYTLTSNQVKISPFGEEIKKHNIITGGNRDTFFPLGTLNFPIANQFFASTSKTLSLPGAYGIMGVSAPRLASFAIGDPTLEKIGKTISLQIYSELPQKIRMIMSEGNNHEATASAPFDLVGGELWQKVLLEPTDFADANMQPLQSFENCTLFFFTSEYDFSISNMTML